MTLTEITRQESGSHTAKPQPILLMSALGPHQFNLTLYDKYPANNPADPSDDLVVEVKSPVTVFWNLDRTALDPEKDPDVAFGKPRWTKAGAGPHNVYQEKMAGHVVLVGTLLWELHTEVLRTVETNASAKKYRLVFTPVVRLMGTFTPATGGSPKIEERYMASASSKGAWQTMP